MRAAERYVTIHSDGTRGTMVVEADGGTRRSRGAAIAAARRALEKAHYVTVTGTLATSYSETWGFQTRTRITYAVRSSDVPTE